MKITEKENKVQTEEKGYLPNTMNDLGDLKGCDLVKYVKSLEIKKP